MIALAAQTVKFMFSNVAYRPTCIKNWGSLPYCERKLESSLSLSCKQGYVPLKTLEYNESCFSIQVWYSTFFKDKPGANDDMCVFYWSQFQIVYRYATALLQTAFSI